MGPNHARDRRFKFQIVWVIPLVGVTENTNLCVLYDRVEVTFIDENISKQLNLLGPNEFLSFPLYGLYRFDPVYLLKINKQFDALKRLAYVSTP